MKYDSTPSSTTNILNLANFSLTLTSTLALYKGLSSSCGPCELDGVFFYRRSHRIYSFLLASFSAILDFWCTSCWVIISSNSVCIIFCCSSHGLAYSVVMPTSIPCSISSGPPLLTSYSASFLNDLCHRHFILLLSCLH